MFASLAAEKEHTYMGGHLDEVSLQRQEPAIRSETIGPHTEAIAA